MEQRKDYRQVPNFNLMPLEYRKPTVSYRKLSLRLLLVLVIVIVALFTQNLYQQKSTTEAAINSAQQKVERIEKKFAAVNAEKEEAKELQAAIEALNKERTALEAARRELGIKQADWPQVLATFLQPPEGVKLISIKQSGLEVTADGTASNYTELLEYRRLLLASPAISQIVSLKSEKGTDSISFSLKAEVSREAK